MTDVVLIGAGIMSATLHALLRELAPRWQVTVVERLPGAGLESSHAWHNEGTGHAGLCEFDYTPRRTDGTIDVTAAIRIGEQFATSLVFWARLVSQGRLSPDFIRPVPPGTDDAAFAARTEELTRIVYDMTASFT